jgi:hypothetical protein
MYTNRVEKYFTVERHVQPVDIRKQLEDAEQMGYVTGYNYAMEIAPKQKLVLLGIAFIAGVLACHFMQLLF